MLYETGRVSWHPGHPTTSTQTHAPQKWVPKDRGYLFALHIIQYSQRKKKNQFFSWKDRKGSFFDTFQLSNHRSPKLAFYDVKPFLTLASRIYFSFSVCRMCTYNWSYHNYKLPSFPNSIAIRFTIETRNIISLKPFSLDSRSQKQKLFPFSHTHFHAKKERWKW